MAIGSAARITHAKVFPKNDRTGKFSVLASGDPAFAVGDRVVGEMGWTEVGVMASAETRRVSGDLPAAAHLGVLGMYSTPLAVFPPRSLWRTRLLVLGMWSPQWPVRPPRYLWWAPQRPLVH